MNRNNKYKQGISSLLVNYLCTSPQKLPSISSACLLQKVSINHGIPKLLRTNANWEERKQYLDNFNKATLRNTLANHDYIYYMGIAIFLYFIITCDKCGAIMQGIFTHCIVMGINLTQYIWILTK